MAAGGYVLYEQLMREALEEFQAWDLAQTLEHGRIARQRRPRISRTVERDRRILARYLDGVPNRDIAREFSTSVANVDRIIAVARAANPSIPKRPPYYSREAVAVAS